MKVPALALAATLAFASAGVAAAQYNNQNQGPPPNQGQYNQNQGQYNNQNQGPPPNQGQYNGQQGPQGYQQGPPGGDPWAYGNNNPGTYRPEWDRRPPPRRGACFFTDANFNGHRFCVRSGDRLPYLPEGYGHSISSIRTFGGASITAFARRDFQGQRAQFRDAPDLGYTSNGPNRGWNDRISSVIVQ